MVECRCGVSVRQLAGGGDVHVEEGVVEVESRVVEGSLEDERGVQGADFKGGRWDAEARDGRAVPVVPVEVGGAGGWGPEIRGDVNFEVAV